MELIPFPNVELLSKTGMDEYAGKISQNPTPNLANLLDVPETAASMEEVEQTLLKCKAVVKALLQRAMDGSSSSRLVLQYQVIQLVGAVFTEVVPIPKPQTVAVAMGVLSKHSVGTDVEAQRQEVQKQQQEREEAARKAREVVQQAVAEEKERKEQQRTESARQLMQFLCSRCFHPLLIFTIGIA